jgi:predicted ester cyclase
VAAYRFRTHLTERSVASLVGDDSNHTCSEISVHRHTHLTVDDKVVTRCIVHRTHDRGEFMGVAPTGREITLLVIVIHRIEGARSPKSGV